MSKHFRDESFREQVVMVANSRWQVASHWFNQTSFTFFLILIFITPTWWGDGPFAWWPVATFEEVAGESVRIGIFCFLPLIVGAGWLMEKAIQGKLQTRIKTNLFSVQWFRSLAATFLPHQAIPIMVPFFVLTLWMLLRVKVELSHHLLVQISQVGLSWIICVYVVDKRPSFVFCASVIILVQSLVALGQFWLQQDLGFAEWGELPLDPAVHGTTMLYARNANWLRAYGFTVSPNLLGAMLAIWLLLLIPVYYRADGRKKWGLGSIVTIGLMGLFVTFSRAAWLGLVGGLFVWSLYTFFPFNLSKLALHFSRFALPLIPVTLLFIFYHDLVVSRVTHLDTPMETRSIVQRQTDYGVAVQMIQENWMVGVGWENYVEVADRMRGITGSVRVHHVPLLVWAELGVVGFLCGAWLTISPFWVCYHRAKRKFGRFSPPSLSPLHLWVAAFIINQFDKTIWFSRNWQTVLLFTLVVAITSLAVVQQAE